MKAFGLHQYGGSEALQVIELPTPHPTAGQVRMQALAASINPVDEILCSSDLGAWYADTPHPYIDEIQPNVDAACIQPQIISAIRDGDTGIVLRPDENQSLQRGIRSKFVNVRDRATDHETIARICQQVAASGAVAAHRLCDAGDLRGHIVLDFEHSGL